MEKEEQIKYGPDSTSQMDKERERLGARERERVEKRKEMKGKKCLQHGKGECKKLPGARQRGRGIQCHQNYLLMPRVSNQMQQIRPTSNKSILKDYSTAN